MSRAPLGEEAAMALLKGREWFLYSRRPRWDMVLAGYFVLVGLAVLVIGLVKVPPVAALAVAPFALAWWSVKRVRWTRNHPEVQRRVLQQSDQRLTSHPVRNLVISVLLLGAVGAYELWRVTLGSRHHHGPPPVWAWPVVVVAGMVFGYVTWRVRLSRARQRESGARPYPQTRNRSVGGGRGVRVGDATDR